MKMAARKLKQKNKKLAKRSRQSAARRKGVRGFGPSYNFYRGSDKQRRADTYHLHRCNMIHRNPYEVQRPDGGFSFVDPSWDKKKKSAPKAKRQRALMPIEVTLPARPRDSSLNVRLPVPKRPRRSARIQNKRK